MSGTQCVQKESAARRVIANAFLANRVVSEESNNTWIQRSAFVMAEISATAPRKLFIFIIKLN